MQVFQIHERSFKSVDVQLLRSLIWRSPLSQTIFFGRQLPPPSSAYEMKDPFLGEGVFLVLSRFVSCSFDSLHHLVVWLSFYHWACLTSFSFESFLDFACLFGPIFLPRLFLFFLFLRSSNRIFSDFLRIS